MRRKDWLPHALVNPRDPDAYPKPGRPRYRTGPKRKTAVFREQGRSVAARLRAARFRDGRNGRRWWSLRSVARRAEMNFGVLSQIETGRRRPAADDLIHLADVLGEDREELLVRAGYLPESALANRGKFDLNAAERELIGRVRRNPRLLEALNAFLGVISASDR